MKQSLLVLCIIFMTCTAQAQKDFQGIITYRLHSSIGDKPDAELKMLFGIRKIKVLFKEQDEYDKETLVIMLDSASVYNANFETKTFRRNSLTLTAPVKTPDKKTFTGYSATPFKPENTGLSGLLGGMLGTSSVIFYLADSLHYYIPAAFAGNKELLMIQQGHIVLGADVQIINTFGEMVADSSAGRPNLVTVEAIEIKPMVLDENEFLIPADFVDRKDIQYPVADSAITIVDTTAVAVDTISTSQKRGSTKRPAKKGAPKAKAATKGSLRKE